MSILSGCGGGRCSVLPDVLAVLGGGETHGTFESPGKVVFVFHAHIGTDLTDGVVCTLQ